MKKTILLSLLLLVPLVAAAEVPPTAPAATLGSQGFDLGLSFLSKATTTPAADGALPLTGIEGAIQAQSVNCCVAAALACRTGCVCGVFEFNCNPSTCQSSCICNICP